MLVRFALVLALVLLPATSALAKKHHGKLPQITAITTALKPATHTIGVRATTKANDYDRSVRVTATLGDGAEQELPRSKDKSVFSGVLEGRYFGAGQRVPLLLRLCGTMQWRQLIIIGKVPIFQYHEERRCVTRGVFVQLPGTW